MIEKQKTTYKPKAENIRKLEAFLNKNEQLEKIKTLLNNKNE